MATWVVPVPLGPKARNLNRDIEYKEQTINQLALWTESGFLTGTPELSSIDAVPDYLDKNAPLDKRARAWLDVNCAHCHQPGGGASNSGLDLRWEQDDPFALGVRKPPKILW